MNASSLETGASSDSSEDTPSSNINFETNSAAENDDPDFMTKTWKEDLCLVVEGKRLFVAKLILAVASPVFERMFQREFEEKGKNEIELPGKVYHDVKEFLKCIYPNIMKDITVDNATKVLALADEYQVLSLKSKCEACLLVSLDEDSPAKDVYKLLDLACLFSLEDLKDKCTTLAAEMTFNDLDEAEEQTPVRPEAKVVIQRKFIEKMAATQIETKLMIAGLMKEQKRMTALYNYHRIGTAKNKQLSSEDYKEWEGASIVSKIDTKKFRPYLNRTEHTCTRKICGTCIIVEFKFSSNHFRLVISVPDTIVKKHTIRLVGGVVVVNGLHGKEDFWRRFDEELNKYSASRIVPILKETDVLGDEGYLCNGEIGVEVHLLALKK